MCVCVCVHCNLVIVQVFIDELNTSSYGGCFKEIIANKTFRAHVSSLFVTPQDSNPSFSITTASPREFICDSCL